MQDEFQAREAFLLKEAIIRFKAATGFEVEVLANEMLLPDRKRLDALVKFDWPGKETTYAVEIKTQLTKTVVGLVAEQLKKTGYKGLLVTNYVNPNMAERLKELDLAFIDLAGNIYVNEPPVLIYIKGNRPADKEAQGRALQPTRAFQTTGLKVLFGLLVNPQLIQATYREIADVTDVALGTVGEVINDLKQHGLVHEGIDGGRQLHDRRQIFEKWTTAYPEKLRPKLHIARYRAPHPEWWRNAQLDAPTAQWGGEIAAALLTKYLKPHAAVIYADRAPARLIVEHQLEKDPEGEVEMLRRFWDPALGNTTALEGKVGKELVPPLLIYADLMATADARNIETAKLIYDEYLA